MPFLLEHNQIMIASIQPSILVRACAANCSLRSVISMKQVNSIRRYVTQEKREEEKPMSPGALNHLYTRWFPKDKVTQAQLGKYIQIDKKVQQDIKIGILYDNEEAFKSSKVIESLLADPFASGNEEWFKKIENRSRKENNIFQSPNSNHSSNDKTNITSTIYSIASPILSSDSRPLYKEASIKKTPLSDFNVFNDIQINEINDLNLVNDFENLCHFYILITNDLQSSINKYPEILQKQILVTIIDNPEYTPRSTETQELKQKPTSISNHVIKVDSNSSYEGIIEFLKNDTSAASQFIESMQKSNIYEALKFIHLYLSSDILGQWTLKNVIKNIKNSINEENSVVKTYENLKTIEIPIFSEQLHSELQYQLIPQTTHFFKKKLRWWKLYLKNDNIEYDLKDYFNRNFMNQSIENYNYFRGLINSQIQQEKYGLYEKTEVNNNPILNLKNQLVSERIENEIQPVVYNSIVEGFLFYQLPVSVVSACSYLFFGFELETAGALALLGWVVGFNYVSKVWEKFSMKWTSDFFEEVRILLGKQCIDEGLLKELKNKYQEEQNLVQVKSQILTNLEALQEINYKN